MKSLRYSLDNEGIASFAGDVKTRLQDECVGRRDIILLSLTMEEILLAYRGRSGCAREFEVRTRRKGGMAYYTLIVPGDAYDPLENGTPLLASYLEKLKYKPEWRCENGENRIVLPVFLQETLAGCLKSLFKYMKGSRRLVTLASAVQLFNFAAVVLLPLLSANLIIQITDSRFLQLVLTGAAVLVANSINDACVYVRTTCISQMSNEMLNAMEIDMVRKNFSISNHCVDTNGSGVFIQRLTTDTEKLSESFRKLIDQSGILLPFIGTLISAFFINPFVCAFMILGKVILGFIEFRRTNSQNRDDRKTRSKSDGYYGIVSESIRGSRDIKLLNTEEKFLQRISDTIRDTNRSRIDMQKKSAGMKLLRMIVTNALNFLLILLLGYCVYEGAFAPAIAVVLFNYNTSLSGLPYQAGLLAEYIKDMTLSAERIFELDNDYEFPKEAFGSEDFDGQGFQGNIEFSHVAFAYNHHDLLERDNVILRDVSFRIHAGETVAFVGGSGSGKTTIFNLVSGLYRVDSGEILLDGKNINDLSKSAIRDNMIFVSQSPYIFNMSIRDNLRIVKSDLTDEEMVNACRLACLDEDIGKMENGYDTIVGEAGITLSGGQKQRLAIARAFLKNCRVIFLDEATSALDNLSQKKVQGHLQHSGIKNGNHDRAQAVHHQGRGPHLLPEGRADPRVGKPSGASVDLPGIRGAVSD